eukprot:2355696-Rhodomonas_salina.1
MKIGRGFVPLAPTRSSSGCNHAQTATSAPRSSRSPSFVIAITTNNNTIFSTSSSSSECASHLIQLRLAREDRDMGLRLRRSLR